MPNKVMYNSDEYFVIDIYYYGKNGIKYKLDDGHWVDAKDVSIID